MAKRQRPDDAPVPQAPEGSVLSLADLGVAQDGSAPDLPRLRKSPPFLFLFHPERWLVLEGQVIPALKRQPLVNAVNGITQGKDGKYNLSKFLEVQKKRGWTMLDPMIDGEQSYLYAPIEGVYLTRWETAHAGSSHVTSGGKGYATWLRKLIAIGKIPAPLPYVLESMLAVLRSDAARLQDQVRVVPSVQVDLDAKLLAISVVERELGGHTPTPIPKKTSTDPLAGLVATE